MLTEHADPRLRLQRARHKQRIGPRGMFQDGENVSSVCGDGVKPKALAPQFYSAGMTGDRGWEFQGSAVGFPLSKCL